MNPNKEQGWRETGGKIHVILNETLYRKLSVKEAKRLIKLISLGIAQAEKRGAERAAKIVREHRLSDWSGEAEVEAELEQIAQKIEAARNLSSKEE